MTKKILTAFGAAALTAIFLAPKPADGVPAYTRQTGMTCAQCHTSFGAPVPNFTFTGKRFRINGYRMPYTAEKIEAGRPGMDNGKRLSLPRIPYIAFRYQNTFLSQRKGTGADEAGDLSTAAPSRLSFFPAGAFGDNFGMWAEMYIIPGFGFPGQDWTLGTISFEEWDLRYTLIGEQGTFGFGVSNQSALEAAGFGPWPIYLTNYIGGDNFIGWAHPNRVNLNAYTFLNNEIFLYGAVSPGEDDFNWDNGSKVNGQVAWAPLNSDNNELWLGVNVETGDDGIPLASTTIPTKDKTWLFVDRVKGVSDLRADASEAGATSYTSDDIGDFTITQFDVRYGFMYKEPHSLETDLRLTLADETYEDNAELTHTAVSFATRYLYDLTWGIEFTVDQPIDYTFTDAQGTEFDVEDQLDWTIGASYRPTMNFILRAHFGRDVQPTLVDEEAPTGWNWSLSTDFVL